MFKLPELSYKYNALEPFIDTQTMQVHHGKHHQTYVDKLNAVIEKEPSLQGKTIEEILTNLLDIKEDIRTAVVNNGGGHFNHSFFWGILSPNSVFNPNSSIGKEIVDVFGSFEEFKEEFSTTALNRFGSGYAWLVLNNKKLEIIDTLNQDSPISIGKIPLLCIDVWEHAYYLKYQNKRADYINAWWNIVNWDEVDKKFSKATL